MVGVVEDNGRFVVEAAYVAGSADVILKTPVRSCSRQEKKSFTGLPSETYNKF